MKLFREPKLRDAILIAGWPGMGLVAYKAVSYLIEKMEVKPLANFDLPDIYQIRGINITDGIVEKIEIPRGRAYYLQANGEARDLIIFLGDEQPVAGKELLLSEDILKMAKKFGCREVYTFAAMVAGIDHHATPRVFGCATNSKILEKMKAHDILPMSSGQISGLNGLLIGIAPAMGMEGACLLGELPYYANQIAYYPASCSVLEKFVGLCGINLELESMRQRSKTTQIEIDTYIEQIKQEAMRRRDSQTPSSEPEDSPKEGGEGGEDVMN